MPISQSFAAMLAAAALATVIPAFAQEEVQTPAAAVQAGAPEADEPDLEQLLWVARPLVVFADAPEDPRFVQQMRMLEAGAADLEERKVVVLTDTDPAAEGSLRRELRPRGFGLVLIDTDGLIVQRRPAPTTVRELSGAIDRLPSRREEIGSRRP